MGRRKKRKGSRAHPHQPRKGGLLSAANWRAQQLQQSHHFTDDSSSSSEVLECATSNSDSDSDDPAAAWAEQRLRERRQQLAAATPHFHRIGMAPSIDAHEDDVRKAYRHAALQHHPDKGGSAKAFRQLVKSLEAVLAFIGEYVGESV
jgi:hypothetical protein